MNYWKRNIPDPIRGLTLDRLTHQIESFKHGVLADFAITAEAMEDRDDMLKNVITKRKKAITRHGWEILTEECTEEAHEHRSVLDFFYRNLTCSHALRENERGGFQLLIQQMMDAVAKGYAVHEIIWKPSLGATFRQCNGTGKSSAVTAEFRFVPLWYFEATLGRLRFLSSPFQLSGVEISERDWLVTVGDALMVACSRAFLFKHYPLQAWLDYTQKFGMPGVRGTTIAARGTPEFTDMEDALRTFMDELAVVTNTSEAIDVIDLKGLGQPPFSDLVERMDRVMASLWRGADLSTLSRDKGYGATLQEQEARILEQDDARQFSEHLNATVDRWVLEQFFGPSVKPLARVRILVTPRECTPHDLAIDQFLLAQGAKLPLSDTLERYGRVQAKTGEPFLGKTPNPEKSPAGASAALSERANPQNGADSGGIKNTRRNAVFHQLPEFMKMKLHNSTVTGSAIDQPKSERQEEYIQISPIGLFPHSKGFQNVDRTALETLAKNFRSFFGRLGRRFAGIPFYVGHPDVPGFENQYQDRKAYGWIKDLEVREDGLYGKTTWSSAGRDLIANGHFKFLSPYWEAIRIGSRDGRSVYSPTVLKSVGLTNEPNLPVFPLANSGETLDATVHSDLDACLGITVGLCSSGMDRPELQNSKPAEIADVEQQRENISAPEFPIEQHSASLREAHQSGISPLAEIHECKKQIALLNQRLIQTILDTAIANARILPVERKHWNDALSSDFENASADLANVLPKLKTVSQTDGLRPMKATESAEQKQKKILTLVHDKMRSSGLSYHQAWIAISSENIELF